MTRHRIVFLERGSLAPEVRFGRPNVPHHWVEYDHTPPDKVIERLAGADIAIVNKVRFDAATLSRLPDLRLIAVAATGTDILDLDHCRVHGPTVCNVRGYATTSVPEHVFGLILALDRQILAYRDSVRRGRWQDSGQFCYFDHPISDLRGKCLGIVGAGGLGRAVADLGRAFGMRPVFAARKAATVCPPDRAPFGEVLEAADVLTLHCPLTPDTAGLIALPELRRMTRRPLLVNTARGGLVVEEDLEAALDAGLVRGAALDVTRPEPPPTDHAAMRLARRPNVILTPHVAWASLEAQQALADQVIASIEAFAAGSPVNVAAAPVV